MWAISVSNHKKSLLYFILYFQQHLSSPITQGFLYNNFLTLQSKDAPD